MSAPVVSSWVAGLGIDTARRRAGESNTAALKGGVSGSFPDSIFEKLFDPELRLRLHSYALPDVGASVTSACVLPY